MESNGTGQKASEVTERCGFRCFHEKQAFPIANERIFMYNTIQYKYLSTLLNIEMNDPSGLYFFRKRAF